MADSQPETDSVGDLNDDSQLTIRIPNPKVFMARQSQWKGRRGKPRCDHCRVNNLKCDRVLPSCNHCSWVVGRECKYTPLPTPAHRGIPRCDRCRAKNLKCDRSLPVCNNCSEENENECNYTPKKRHKIPSEHGLAKDRQLLAIGQAYNSKTASFLVSDMPSMEDQLMSNGGDAPSSSGHTFYGQNVASSLAPYGTSASPMGYPSDAEASRPHKYSTPESWRADTPSSHPATRTVHPENELSFISHSFPPERPAQRFKTHIEPWTHAAFAPLPDVILRRISCIDVGSMPDRTHYNDGLSRFISDLTPELRETAALAPEVYAKLARCVAKRDFSELSERLRFWAAIHHLRCGSEKYHLLMMPRDAYYRLDKGEEEHYSSNFVARIDGKQGASMRSASGKEPDWMTAFERLPVQTQIFDILVYAHRAHIPAASMLLEIRKLGIATITWPMAEIFYRLCPQCNPAGKSAEGSVKAEASTSFHSFSQYR